MSKSYYFVGNEEAYSFETIQEMIINGQVVKESFIWEESMPDWGKLGEHPDFADVFKVLDEEANENLAKAMGTDKESIKKKEMKALLSDVGNEKIKMEGEGLPFKLILIILLVVAGLSAVYYFGFMSKGKNETVSENVTAENNTQPKTINEETLRFSSGVTKLDSVKGLKITKTSDSEEKNIIAEAILAEKQSKGILKESDIKAKSIFDLVGDDEIKAFRANLMKGQNINSKSVTGNSQDMMGTGEELTSKQINEVLKVHSKSTIGYCYNKSLKEDYSLEGKLEIKISVLGNGNVAKVETLTDKFKGTNLSRCVSGNIKKKWKFPAFKGTVTDITIPFILSN